MVGLYEDGYDFSTKAYFLAAADLLGSYLSANPQFNGKGRRMLDHSIKVFREGDETDAIINWTLLGTDERNIPDFLWDALLDLGKVPSGRHSLENSL